MTLTLLLLLYWMALVLYNEVRVRGQISKAGNFEPLLYDNVVHVQGLIYDFILNNFLTAERSVCDKEILYKENSR